MENKLKNIESLVFFADKKPALLAMVIAALFLSMIFIPAMYYVMPFIFLVLAMVKIFKNNPSRKSFLMKWMLIAFVLRILYLCIVQFGPPNDNYPFYFYDDKSYHKHSVHLAERWHQGLRPEIWADYEIGTMQTGYYRFVSAIYYVLGTHVTPPLIANTLLGALMCLLLFHAAKAFFDEKIAEKTMILTAVNPVFWFWSSLFVKDTLLAVMFMFVLFLYIEFRNKPSILTFFAIATSSYFLTILRIPSIMVIIATACIYEMIYNPYRRKVMVLIILGVAAGFLMRLSVPVREIQNQFLYSFLNMLPDQGKTLFGAFKMMGMGFPRFFLAPYAWVIGTKFDAFYFLYPGQWFVYLLILPFSILGFIRIIRENNPVAVWLVFPIILKGYLYLMIFGGSAPRHVHELEGLITILAAYGMKKQMPPIYMYSYYSGLILFMLTHLLSIIFGK